MDEKNKLCATAIGMFIFGTFFGVVGSPVYVESPDYALLAGQICDRYDGLEVDGFVLDAKVEDYLAEGGKFSYVTCYDDNYGSIGDVIGGVAE